MMERNSTRHESAVAALSWVLLLATLVGGCAIAPAVAERAPSCRPSATEPGVEVCQDGGRITVVAAHDTAVDAERLAREAVDVSALPRVLPQAEILSSEVSACRAAHVGPEAGLAEGEVKAAASAVTVECRLRLTLEVSGASP